MKVKKIEWSEERPANEHIPYDHVIGTTPLGSFEITWKGWKESPSFTLEHTIFGYVSDYASLNDAKKDAQVRFEETVRNCLDEE